MTQNNSADLQALQDSIGHQFLDSSLLSLAFRHKSAGKPNNQRLEFLGDAILNAVVAEMLYLQDDSAAEGRMTAARAQLVKGETLAEIGSQLGVARLMVLGQGERGQGRIKHSILEDAVEALIGAVFLDAGFDKSRQVCVGIAR